MLPDKRADRLIESVDRFHVDAVTGIHLNTAVDILTLDMIGSDPENDFTIVVAGR